MRKTNDRRFNLLSFEAYSLLYLLMLLLMGILYVREFACLPITGWRIPILISTAVTVGGLLWLLTVRRERRGTSLMACTLFPYLLYEMISLSGIAAVRLMLLGSFCAALTGGLFLAGSSRRFRKSRTFRRRRTVLCTVICWTLLLLPLTIEAHKLYDGTLVDRAMERQAALESALVTLDSRWQTLGQAEKLDALRILMAAECHTLGLTNLPDLAAASLPEAPAATLGQYVPKHHIIRLSAAILEEKDGWSAARVLLHEVRHAYQSALIRLYGQMPESDQNLALFDDARTYAREYQSYISPDGTAASMMAYSGQHIERDAEAYADLRLAAYQNLCSTIK